MPLDGVPNRTNSQSLPIKEGENNQVAKREITSDSFPFDIFVPTRLHPFVNFRGQISVGDYLFPIQEFSLSEKDRVVSIESFPTNSFPKIEIILEEKNSVYGIKEFKVRPSDNSVQGEILYTRFFLAIAHTKKCSLNFRDVDFPPFNFSFSDITLEEKRQMLYRAKLFRKLGFIERVFENAKLNVPENITANDAKQIEILFRAITEGEFTIPADNSITIFNYKISEEDLQNISISQRREFSFEFDEELLVLGKFFSTGKMKFKAEKASIANPRILRNHAKGDVLPTLRLNIFDNQVHHRFEKYVNPAKLLKNRQKLEQFKNLLRKEEPEFLVDLLNEPLAEVDEKSAIEIVEGLLQYHDFPDRFSVLNPKLEKTRWRVPIALTYPNYEPILLSDAFVDIKTGKVEMKISFDKLRKKGKVKAKEAFSVE